MEPLLDDLMTQYGESQDPVYSMSIEILLKYPTFIKLDTRFNLREECQRLEQQVKPRLQTAYSVEGGFVQTYVNAFRKYDTRGRLFILHSTLFTGLKKCLDLKLSSSPMFYSEVQRLCIRLILIKYFFHTPMTGGRRTRKYKR